MSRSSFGEHRQYLMSNLWTIFMISIAFSLVYTKVTQNFFSGEAVFWTFVLHVYLCIVGATVVTFPDLSWIKWSKRVSGGRVQGRSFLQYNMTGLFFLLFTSAGWFFESPPYQFLRILWVNSAAILMLRFIGYIISANSRLLHNTLMPSVAAVLLLFIFRAIFHGTEHDLLLLVGHLSVLMIFVGWISHLYRETPRRIPVLFLHIGSLIFLTAMYFQLYTNVSRHFLEMQEQTYFQLEMKRKPYTEPAGGHVDDGGITGLGI